MANSIAGDGAEGWDWGCAWVFVGRWIVDYLRDRVKEEEIKWHGIRQERDKKVHGLLYASQFHVFIDGAYAWIIYPGSHFVFLYCVTLHICVAVDSNLIVA